MSRRSSWRSKIAWVLGSLLLCVLLGELASRAYWRVGYGVPFEEPGRVLHAYYPELRVPESVVPRHDDDYFDILVLSGSVLYRDFSTVVRETHERLASAGHRAVRIFNLSAPAHTSRDSMLKYAALVDSRFELVIFYHGINDARANNAPPDVYRDDYGHFAWYETVNAMARYHRTARAALPQTLEFLSLRLRQRANEARYVSLHAPRPDWLRYGAELRSAAAFGRNLRAITGMAAERGDPLLLMTFATHVPADYSDAAFRARRLDYALHLFGMDQWGVADNVVAAVAAHNGVVRALASEQQLSLLDQARLMQGSARTFNDPCHLTNLGSHQFSEHLLQVLLPRFE